MCGIGSVVVRSGCTGACMARHFEGLTQPLSRRGPDLMGSCVVNVSDGTHVAVDPVAKVTPEAATCAAGPPVEGVEETIAGAAVGILAHVLSMRGRATSQPAVDADTGIVLGWNGEAYSGLPDLGLGDNDTNALLAALAKADSARADATEVVPKVLSAVRGPWAVIIWHPRSRRLWFGRDFFGRRSLLWNIGEPDTPEFLMLASVSPSTDAGRWEEVPATGLHYVQFPDATAAPGDGPSLGRLDWGSSDVFPRPIAPFNGDIPKGEDPVDADVGAPAVEALLLHLEKSVRRRVQWLCGREEHQASAIPEDGVVPKDLPSPRSTLQPPAVAILFSGGIDSMMLAAVLDRVLPPHVPVDLVNVAFDNPRLNQRGDAAGQYRVPDRLTGEAGVEELRALSSRPWRFIPVNVPFEELSAHRDNIKRLVRPLGSVMDESIGCALWFAARAVRESRGEGAFGSVVLVGMGADEQLAGYGRHRTRFDKGGWEGLVSEVAMDIDRISSRNLGRDDRIISDHGIEARFPFLDEEVVSFLNALPIQCKVDFRLPRGIGEKKILRDCARTIGLRGSADLPKRAIQFGSRIAKIDGAKVKGSDNM